MLSLSNSESRGLAAHLGFHTMSISKVNDNKDFHQTEICRRWTHCIIKYGQQRHTTDMAFHLRLSPIDICATTSTICGRSDGSCFQHASTRPHIPLDMVLPMSGVGLCGRSPFITFMVTVGSRGMSWNGYLPV